MQVLCSPRRFRVVAETKRWPVANNEITATACSYSKGITINWNCMDCNVNTYEIDEYYTVYDDIWLTAHPADQGLLCIGCLESRLGRLLTADDFPCYPINNGAFRQSARLLNRLGR
jgi:hypothetical protein